MLALKGGRPVRTKAWPAWPERGDEELARLKIVLERGRWGGYPAPGVEAQRFGRQFGSYLGSKQVVLAANGTVTLKVILRAMDIKSGDEVIVPSLTWIATAAAAVYINAVPVFADLDPDSLCLDPASVEALITERTRAVICVHLGSTMADVEALLAICKKHGLTLIEDCAHAHGMKWKGKAAGTFGKAGSFSFQSSKLLTSGEGGAICTDDDQLAKRCQSLVNCGRKDDTYADFEGNLFGWNDRLTEFQAALLSAQLERLDDQHLRREENLRHFLARLSELPDLGLVPQKRDARISRATMYELVLLYDARRWKGLPRDRFVAALEAEGVHADGGFYTPIQDRVGEIFSLRAVEYPAIRERYGEALRPEQVVTPVATQAAYERTVWLHHALFLGDERDVDDIVDAIFKIRENVDALL